MAEIESKTRRKWDRISQIYDLVTFAETRGKNARIRKEMLKEVKGKILEVGIGTGHNIQFYPSGHEIVGIDLSEQMLKRAEKKARMYKGSIELKPMDAQKVEFDDNTFDTVVTTCVFCSVPDPIAGLREIRRVLKPGGRLLMYEHVLSKNRVLAFLMNLANPLISTLIGPNINRDTVGNVRKAGLVMTKEENVKYDIFKRIDAVKTD